jgi:hypothetical protein
MGSREAGREEVNKEGETRVGRQCNGMRQCVDMLLLHVVADTATDGSSNKLAFRSLRHGAMDRSDTLGFSAVINHCATPGVTAQSVCVRCGTPFESGAGHGSPDSTLFADERVEWHLLSWLCWNELITGIARKMGLDLAAGTSSLGAFA